MPLPDGFFRKLDAKEEAQFRAWARENHKFGDEISELWHPVVRSECHLIDEEANVNFISGTDDD